MKYGGLLLAVVLPGLLTHAQVSRDSLLFAPEELKMVEVFGISPEELQATQSLRDEQLTQFDHWMDEQVLLSTHKRGAFAYEPILRGQSGDRMNIVIDGIRIAGACTDHMDPVTSYIEPANFEAMNITPGGGSLSGSATAGSIELKTRSPRFNQNKVFGEIGSAFRSNGMAFNHFGKFGVSLPKTAISGSYTRREHQPYTDGRGQEVKYTQFSKHNFHLQLNRRFGQKSSLSLKYIGDRGRDIGYPGLLMDVSRADADIFGAKLNFFNLGSSFKLLRIGAYYSDVYHEMDDTKRPPEEVAMHMDMPGWTSMAGVTGEAHFRLNERLKLEMQSEFYRRSSRAEMTMYPEGEGEMFMLTWPDIKRNVARSALRLTREFNMAALRFDANAEYHKVFMDTILGFQQFSVFGKAIDSSLQFLPYSLDLSYEYQINDFNMLTIKLGNASRAPSRTELYGYYLFNAEDGFDYLGNPDLKSENLSRIDLRYDFKKERFRLKTSVFYNHYRNFIFGLLNEEIGGATPGTMGLKQFQNMESAFFTGFEVENNMQFNKHLLALTKLSYVYAERNDKIPMPQIAPLEFILSVNYRVKNFSFNPKVTSNAAQNRVDIEFGEDASASWMIADFSVNWKSKDDSKYPIMLKAEVSNIFDQYYWSHLDWRNIPRQGRSFNLSLSIGFSKDLKKPTSL